MPITAGELKAQLKDVPDDTLIVMSKDAAGNSYSPLARVFSAAYVAETTWSGDVYSLDTDDEDDEWGYAPPEDKVPAVILVPVN
ncbi:MAG: hypothetical protein E6R04_08530 [Spirochaetes bacterium]|nr:MAG: hypothetical protein E6R04_08530 [Spirochaetota bacterium]